MTDHVHVRSGAYADSVTLLQVSKRVAATPGVSDAQVAMATGLNLETLAAMGFTIPAEATANDMIVALRLDVTSPEDVSLEDALAAVDAALADSSRRPGPAADTTVAPPRTTATALRDAPGDAVVLVSVPGPSAFVEAMDAVEAGHDVMLFSDNVALEQEIALKEAAGRDVLVMGPDCGTAVVGGVGLGFANVVQPGPVGVVAASGTGTQQVLALLDQAGVGVSAALGVGGRDLSSAVGGRSTRTALARLDADPATSHVVLISKPPAPEVAESVWAYAKTLSVPVETAMLAPGTDLTARTEALLATLGVQPEPWRRWGEPEEASGPPGFLRGLFVGGTLCDEAMLIATETLGGIRSNTPLHAGLALDPHAVLDGRLGDGHVMIDFGDDALTVGRAHPMIDPTLRLAALARAAQDPATAAVLLDVVLGHGAEPDPGGALAPAIAAARQTAADHGRTLPVVATLVGTASDPQGLEEQARMLAAAGAYVFTSNAEATRHAAGLVADVTTAIPTRSGDSR